MNISRTAIILFALIFCACNNTSELEREIARLKSENVARVSEIMSLEKLLIQSESSFDSLSQVFNQEKGKLDFCRVQNKGYKDANAELSQEVNDLKKILNGCNQQVTKLNLDFSELSDTLSGAIKLIDSLGRDLLISEKNLEIVKDEHLACQQSLSDLWQNYYLVEKNKADQIYFELLDERQRLVAVGAWKETIPEYERTYATISLMETLLGFETTLFEDIKE